MSTKLILIVSIVSSFILGFITKSLLTPLKKYQVNESRLTEKYKFISPLLECESSDYQPDNFLHSLKDKLTQYISQETSSGNITLASVYYRDLSNGPWIGINELQDFSPASLIKVPLMMAYLKKAETNPGLMDQTLVNNLPASSEAVNIKPAITLVPHQSYTIRELITQMISYSDNESYQLLNQNMPFEALIKVYNDLGVDISKGFSDPNGNILSVKSYASFFRILFNASYLNKDMSEEALRILSLSQFHDGLTAKLPQNIIVAHKFGERQFTDTGIKQLHDCGIIYLPSKPYLLCVMTQGKDFKRLSQIISQISSQIYDELKP